MPSRNVESRIAVALLCALSLCAGGCEEKKVHAAVPATAPTPPEAQRPMTTAPDTDAAPPIEAAEPPPAVPAATPAPPVTLPEGKPQAPRRPAGGQLSADTDTDTSHPPVPQISPQLSPGDQASYERRAGEDISVAEKNLQGVSGRQLSAAQQDLADKIRSFLSQSRDASKSGDWVRAQNLAQKARVLSVELINSF